MRLDLVHPTIEKVTLVLEGPSMRLDLAYPPVEKVSLVLEGISGDLRRIWTNL